MTGRRRSAIVEARADLILSGEASAEAHAAFAGRRRCSSPGSAAGYATRHDLTVIARACFWALVALIVFGIVLIFVQIPGGDLAHSSLAAIWPTRRSAW